MDPNVLKKLNVERAERRACAVVTDLDDGRDRLVRMQDADLIQGVLGEAIQKALQDAKSRMVDIDGRSMFINAHVPQLKIVVIGAVHISQALVGIARAAGFNIEIIDPRTAFATAERFPDVQLFAQWPEDVFKNQPLDHYTALVAVTHDPKIDDRALIAALEARCIYIGALGSKKTHEKRVERLKSLSVTENQIAHISSPIGLDIGAANPGEIAVSIMAEIIETLRQKKTA